MANILIAEDNQKLALFIQEFLRKKGHKSDIALDGLNALKSFAKGSYDLLLVDMKLPVMEGEAVCAKIRASEKGKAIPIIMISGAQKNAGEIESLKSNLKINNFIQKPFSFDLLYSSVTKSLSGQDRSTTTPPPPEHTPPQILKGKFKDRPFEEIISFILEKKLSGLLLAGNGEKKKKFFILKGFPIDMIVSSEEDNFGNYLLKKGLISMAELKVYEEFKKAEGDDPRSIFVKMGCLSAHDFKDENRSYLIENTAECFAWTSGMFIFESKPTFQPEPHGIGADIPLIFFKGFKNNLTPARTEAFLGKKGKSYPRKTKTFFDYQAHLFDIADAYKTFDMLDGTRSCTDIINSTEIDNEAALVIMMTMDIMKMVSYSPMPEKILITPPFPIREKDVTDVVQKKDEPASLSDEFQDLGDELGLLEDELEGIETFKKPEGQVIEDTGAMALEDDLKATWEKIKDKDYYGIFDLTRHTYSFNSLKSAYFDLTRKFSPDKFFASSGEIMSLDQELLSKVSEAYEILSNVVSKENYDEYLDSEEAVSMGEGGEDDKMKIQVQFTSGKVFLEEGQFEGAEKAFTNLVHMVPDKPEYLTYLALSMYNNPVHRRSGVSVKKVKDLINKSLQLGKLSMTYALKGALFFDEGNLSLAEAEFNKALKINPSNKTATKKMEEIRVRREQEKGGLLKRMFK